MDQSETTHAIVGLVLHAASQVGAHVCAESTHGDLFWTQSPAGKMHAALAAVPRTGPRKIFQEYPNILICGVFSVEDIEEISDCAHRLHPKQNKEERSSVVVHC